MGRNPVPIVRWLDFIVKTERLLSKMTRGKGVAIFGILGTFAFLSE